MGLKNILQKFHPSLTNSSGVAALNWTVRRSGAKCNYLVTVWSPTSRARARARARARISGWRWVMYELFNFLNLHYTLETLHYEVASHVQTASGIWSACHTNQKQFLSCESSNSMFLTRFGHSWFGSWGLECIWRQGFLRQTVHYPLAICKINQGSCLYFICVDKQCVCQALFQFRHDVFLFLTIPLKGQIVCQSYQNEILNSLFDEEAETTARLQYLVMSFFPSYKSVSMLYWQIELSYCIVNICCE